MLKLNSELAKAADNVAAGLKETGKYVGVITRAEKLVSNEKGTIGLGLSFKTDTGLTADYLDLYHTRANGEELPGLKTVNAIMCCTKVAEAKEGAITFEAWDNNTKTRGPVSANGYPALMGKRIGFLIQKVLETDHEGKDREKVQIFGVFDAATELTASEMYAKNTSPERLGHMLDALMARPLRDNRKPAKGGASRASSTRGGYDDMPPSDDITF